MESVLLMNHVTDFHSLSQSNCLLISWYYLEVHCLSSFLTATLAYFKCEEIRNSELKLKLLHINLLIVPKNIKKKNLERKKNVHYEQ